MADPVVIATVGAADANSYVTVTECDTYHDAHLYATGWTAATGLQKKQAVIQATRLLDTMLEWHGTKHTDAQALQWPRSGMFDRGGYSITVTELPVDLKNATCDLARDLIAANRTADSEIETQGISRLKAGPVELDFRDTVVAKPISDAVFFNLVPHYGVPRRRGGAATVRLERS